MVRVSVIIPCHDREGLLGATLESLVAQTFPDWEAIVIDDRSSDESLAVARRFARQDPRIRAVARAGATGGPNACRNEGIALAEGEYIIMLDSDDLLEASCLAQRVAAADAAPECGFGVFLTELFTEQVGDRKLLWNVFTETSDLLRFLSIDPVWHTSGPIWRKRTLVQLQCMDEKLLSFQDWDISVRALIARVAYFKCPVRDHFYRFKYDRFSTISAVSCTRIDHLRSHEALFEKIVRQLRVAGHWDREVRSRAAGLFWWLATCMRSNSNGRDADRVWRKAREFDLCNRHQYVEGRLILRLYAIRGGGRLARIIQQFWPPQFYTTRSEYFQQATMDQQAMGAGVAS